MSHRLLEAAAVIALATAMCIGLYLRVEPVPYSQLADSLTYIAMAERPFAEHHAPYCYRILVPTLARILPLNLTASFFVLTFFFIGATGVLLYYLLRALGMSRFFAALGLMMFFGLNWGPRFAFFDFRLTDPALFFFATLAVLLLVRGQRGYAVLALSLGVLAKESVLFVLPYAYTLSTDRIVDTRELRRTILLSLVPVAVALTIRLAIPAQYHPSDLLSTIGRNRVESGIPSLLRGGTVGTWGVGLLLVSLFSHAQGRTWFLRSLPFLALVYVQPFFAINVDRLLVLGFVAMIPLATMGWKRLVDRFHLVPWMTVGYVLIPYGLLLAKNPNSYNSVSPEKEVLFLAIWTVIVWLARRLTRLRVGVAATHTDAHRR